MLKYLKVLLLLSVLVAISPKDLIAGGVMGAYGKDAIQLDIEKYGNHLSLVDKLSKSYRKDYDSFALGKRITPEVKKIIDTKYEGKVEDFIAATFPEDVNILDKSRNYLLVFFSLSDDKTIKRLNAFQKKYLHNTLICGVIQPMTKRIGGVLKSGAQKIDPTFFPRNKALYVKSLEEASKKPGFEEPEFLVCFDEARHMGNIVMIYKAQPKYSLIYRPFRKTLNIGTFALVINKKNVIIWMGQPKDAAYYMKVVGTKTFDWEKNKKVFESMPKQEKYFAISDNPNSQHMLGKQLKTFHDDIIGSPEMLSDFSHKIMRRDLFKYKDTELVLKFCKQTSKLLGPKDSVVMKMYFEYYKLIGEYQKAKNIANRLKLKFNPGITPENYKKFKAGQLLFTNEYWPYLSRSKHRMSEAEARKAEKFMLNNFLADPIAFSAVLSTLMKSSVKPQNNKNFSKFIESCYTSSIRKIIGGTKNINNHVVYESYAIFYYRKKQYQKAADLMKKAITCIKLGKDKKTLSLYQGYLKRFSKKIR